ncbi:MAG: (2Fe-2S) ferredoxin domain-containing protein [Hydrococcus sp. Prado102]|jgi:(2Fe-2S) ferredoxin|nr:(2Fe-2S) ferredoxin domain-containing protein [Hydrococcus sp. Prado102]
MKKGKKEVSTNFTLEGQFLGFVIDQDDNKFKYLRMAVADDEVQIKLSKQARASLFRSLEEHSFLALRPWDFIQVTGEKTLDCPKGNGKADRTTNILKLKAEQITILNVNQSAEIQPTQEGNCQPTKSCPTKTKLSASKSRAKLLVCHRSSCQKRGGRRQHQAIESMLRDRGLHECVVMEKSGCLGKCSMAPNIVLMPGKKRLSGMKPEAIAELLANLQPNN